MNTNKVYKMVEFLAANKKEKIPIRLRLWTNNTTPKEFEAELKSEEYLSPQIISIIKNRIKNG